MKKQTTNTFSEGLLKDFHPLTVPDNVLTDALNATLITMNGNEMILLNDMGNGRVESAFLPSGYVPVGIKEYGGIIYIAAYNPITNKGLVGSFPSPERNIDLTETGAPTSSLRLLDGEPLKFEFPGFEPIYEPAPMLSKLDIFKESSGDGILRSGDKFGLYFAEPNTPDIHFLSNYDCANVDFYNCYDKDNKVYKNNLVTLSIETLDSNNNLNDITYLLKRYDTKGNVIKFDDSINDEDRFNTGYFISRGNLTVSDDPVNLERNKKAVNTYNSKLFGKVFLVGRINTYDHIEVYNSYIVDDNGRKLIFYITLFYNFATNDPNYIIDPQGFFIIKNGQNTISLISISEKEKEEEPMALEEADTSKYDKNTKLYTKQYQIEYPLEDEYEDGDILQYLIVPRLYLSNPDKPEYIPSRAVYGNVNLGKLGKLDISISDWRYYYTKDYMQLTWGLEVYTGENLNVTNVTMYFVDISTNPVNSRKDLDDPSKYFSLPISSKLSYNGEFQEIIPFDDVFLPNKIYAVEIVYTLTTEGEEDPGKEYALHRWMITTPIYNSLYSYNSPDFLSDYNDLGIEENDELRKRLHNIEFNPNMQYTVAQGATSINEELDKVYKVLNPFGKLEESIDEKFPYYKEESSPTGYSLVRITEKQLSCNISFDPSIDSKFPFIIDLEELKYTLDVGDYNFTSSNINKYGEGTPLVAVEELTSNEFSVKLNTEVSEKALTESSLIIMTCQAPSLIVVSKYLQKNEEGTPVKNTFVSLEKSLQDIWDTKPKLVLRIAVWNRENYSTRHAWMIYKKDSDGITCVDDGRKFEIEYWTLYFSINGDHHYTFELTNRDYYLKYQSLLSQVSDEFALFNPFEDAYSYNRFDKSEFNSIPIRRDSMLLFWKSTADEYILINLEANTANNFIKDTKNLYIKTASSGLLLGVIGNPTNVTYNSDYMTNISTDLKTTLSGTDFVKVLIHGKLKPLSDLSSTDYLCLISGPKEESNFDTKPLKDFLCILSKEGYPTTITSTMEVKGMDDIFSKVKTIWEDGITGYIEGQTRDSNGKELDSNYYYLDDDKLLYDFTSGINRYKNEYQFNWLEENMTWKDGKLLVDHNKSTVGQTGNGGRALISSGPREGYSTYADLTGIRKIDWMIPMITETRPQIFLK